MGKSLGKTQQQQQQQRDVKLLNKNLLTFVIVVFFGGFNILSNSPSLSKYSPSLILIQQHSDICGGVLCCRLKHSISRASKNHDTISSSFPPPEWSVSVPSRASKYDNYTAVIDIINNESLDVPFELGSIVTNKSIPTLPFFMNASTFHPCCRDFLSNATNGEQTFENVEFDLADFFRAMGNNSQLFISGDSVSRGSAQSALCALVAAGADFHYMKWDHNKNEELQNETRDWGHAPSICNSWFMGWSSYHNFSLPHPMLTKNARIPLEGPLILSSDNMNGRTFHQLVWMREIRSGVHLSENTDQRVAYLLNFGLHWNLGGSVNNHLKFEDDSPAKLYGHLLNQFQNIASLSNPPIVFWRETTPQLFNSIEIDRSTEGCENFPDIFVGGNFPDGGCLLGGRGGWQGSCQRNNSHGLGWNAAAPFRWRQRLAMHAATTAGLRVAMPPVRSDTAKDLMNSMAGTLLWLPFHDAALQNRALFKESNDCVHPEPFRRAFWSVIWDGMARHIIERQSCIAGQ